MTYYKLLQDGKVIGACADNALRRHQIKHNLLMNGTPINAQYLEYRENLYRDEWMDALTSSEFRFEYAEISEITEEEYAVLKDMLGREQEVTAEEAENLIPEEEPQEIPDADELTVDYVRDVKVREMSLACNRAITEGVDVAFGNSTKHFSLTLQDQANLAAATVQILSGATEIPYHADGDEFRNYTADEMLKIIEAANEHKTYHLAYFNCLKKWVNALVRITAIQGVEYGSDIPKKYQSAFLKSLNEG